MDRAAREYMVIASNQRRADATKTNQENLKKAIEARVRTREQIALLAKNALIELPEVKVNSILDTLAQEQASAALGGKYLSTEFEPSVSDVQQTLNEKGYLAKAAFAILSGGSASAGDVLGSWERSSRPNSVTRHPRDVILSDLTEIGVGLVRAPGGTGFAWCVIFASPWPKLDTSKLAAELVAELNRQRSKTGKPALEIDPNLATKALEMAQLMAGQDTLNPKPPEGQVLPLAQVKGSPDRYTYVGAASVAGATSVDEAVKNGLRVPEPRGSDGDFTHVGAAFAVAPSGRPYGYVLVARARGG